MGQLGTIKVQTASSGAVEVPVYATGDSGSNVYETVRVQTAGGTGFIPVVDQADASHPYLRVQTQNHGVCAVHNDSSLGQTYVFADFSDLGLDGYSGNTGDMDSNNYGFPNDPSAQVDEGTGGHEVYKNFSTAKQPLSTTIRYEIASMPSSDATSSKNSHARYEWFGSGGSSDNAVSVRFTFDGNIKVNGSSIDTFSTGTIYKFKHDFDWGAGTVDTYIDGTLVQSGSSMSATDLKELNHIANQANWKYRWDDVKYTI